MIVGILIAILVLFFILFFGKKNLDKNKNMKRIFLIVYLVWWNVWNLIASTNWFNMFKLRDNTLIILLVSTIAFALGFVIFDIIKKKFGKKNEIVSEIKSLDFNKNKIYLKLQLVIEVCILLILGYYKIKQIGAIGIYGEDLKRNFVFEIGYIFNSVAEAAFFNYILSAAISFFNLLMIRKILLKKIDLTVIIQILSTVLFFSITYGRLVFFELIFYAIMWIIILYGNNIKSYVKENLKWIIACIGFMFIVLLISSFFRVGFKLSDLSTLQKGWEKTTRQAVVYFCGGQKAFDYALKNNYREAIIEEYGKTTNGLASFAWLEQFGNKIFGSDKSLNNILGEKMQKNIKIGEYQEFNAFYTGLFNFYIDFGYVGIFICQFLYGAFISWLISFYIRKPNIARALLLNVNLAYAIFSEFRWYYQSIENIVLIGMTILFVIFTERRRKIYENNVAN